MFRNDYYLHPLFSRLYLVAVLVNLKKDSTLTLKYKILWLLNNIIVA